MVRAASSSESSGAAVATSSSARLPASRSIGDAMPRMRSRSDDAPEAVVILPGRAFVDGHHAVDAVLGHGRRDFTKFGGRGA